MAELRLAVAKLAASAGSRRRELARFGDAIDLLEQRISPDMAPALPAPIVTLRPGPGMAPEVAGVVPHDSATPATSTSGPWDPSWP